MPFAIHSSTVDTLTSFLTSLIREAILIKKEKNFGLRSAAMPIVISAIIIIRVKTNVHPIKLDRLLSNPNKTATATARTRNILVDTDIIPLAISLRSLRRNPDRVKSISGKVFRQMLQV